MNATIPFVGLRDTFNHGEQKNFGNLEFTGNQCEMLKITFAHDWQEYRLACVRRRANGYFRGSNTLTMVPGIHESTPVGML